jgi:hypothetical protein
MPSHAVGLSQIRSPTGIYEDSITRGSLVSIALSGLSGAQAVSKFLDAVVRKTSQGRIRWYGEAKDRHIWP